MAFVNYKALSGDGAAGDGVIPVAVAHLDGARQLTLENVLHSINEAGTTLPTDRWYGSEAVVDRWLAELDWTELSPGPSPVDLEREILTSASPLQHTHSTLAARTRRG